MENIINVTNSAVVNPVATNPQVDALFASCNAPISAPIPANNLPTDNLSPILGSAVFAKLVGYDHETVSSRHTVQVIKKRGDNSRLKESLAVEVPEFSAGDVITACRDYPTLVSKFIDTLYSCQRELLLDMAASGVRTVQYSEITLAKIAASIVPTVRTVKLSKDSITAWYDATAAEVMAVAISERLGLSESIEEADLVKIQQISNQVKGNLAKLAAPKATNGMDERVKKSLQWALDSIIASGLDDTGMIDRLDARLNPPVTAQTVDLAEMLGM